MYAPSANLKVMVDAARKAGRGLMRDFAELENLQASVKAPGDFVSAADRKAEERIKEDLKAARPAYGWLGEETGGEKGPDETRRWIVDPLDGTTNFLRAIPHWSVSIALEHKGEIIAGVVYDPAKQDLFVAEKGGGAWHNDRRIRVAPTRDVSRALLGTGVPFGSKSSLPLTLRELGRLMPLCAGVRRMGSAALDLAYVAAGRLDFFWERELQPWDIAAGVLLVREAGGLVRDLSGGEDPLGTGSVAAGGPNLFEKLNAELI